MSYGGGHLGFPMGIKNRKFVGDLPMIIPGQFGFKPLGQLKPNCTGMIIGRSSTKFLFFYADRKFKMAATANVKFVEDHPMNIHVQFGCNHICSF
jgi:hypothetical protein